MLVRGRVCVSAQLVMRDCVCVYLTEVAPSLQGSICAEDTCCAETARCVGGLGDRVLTALRLLNDGKRCVPPSRATAAGNPNPKPKSVQDLLYNFKLPARYSAFPQT